MILCVGKGKLAVTYIFWWESTLIVLEGNFTIPIKCETYLRFSSFISGYLSHSIFAQVQNDLKIFIGTLFTIGKITNH